MHGVILLTWFCKLLTRVAVLSGEGARHSNASLARRLCCRETTNCLTLQAEVFNTRVLPYVTLIKPPLCIITQSHSSLRPTCFTSSLEPASYITQIRCAAVFMFILFR